MQFLTRLFFFSKIYSFLPPWFVTSTLCYQEGNFQPLWKVKGSGQYTSWKVCVPDFFVRNEQKKCHRHVHEHRHVHIHIQIHIHVRVLVCVFVLLLCGAVSCRVSRVVVGWLGGWVWCGVVDMSLSWLSLSLCRGPSLCVVI